MTTPRTPQESGTPGTVASTPRSRYSSAAGGLVTDFAREVGLSPASASQWLYGAAQVRERILKFLRICRRRRRMDVYLNWIRPIRDEETGALGAAYSAELEREDQEAECREDTARTHYLLHATREEAVARVRAIDRRMHRDAELREALVAKWGLS